MNLKRCAGKGTKFPLYMLGTGLWLTFSLCIPCAAQTTGSADLKELKVKGKHVSRRGITPSQYIGVLDFSKYAAGTVADAVQHLSGTNLKDYGGIGGLKTVSVRSLGANHTGVFYDGIQLTYAQNGQIDLGRLSLNNLRGITLYNGQPDGRLLPARAYASGAVLWLDPLRPAVNLLKPVQVTAGVATGSFGLFEPMLQWDQFLSAKWAMSIHTSSTQANGRYRYQVDGDGSTTSTERKNTDISSWRTDAVLQYSGKDSANFSLRLNYYKSERGLPGAVVFYADDAAQRLWNEDLSLQSKLEKKWQSGIQLSVLARYAGYDVRYLDPHYLNSAGELDQRYQQKEAYLSGALNYQLSEKLLLAYAADGAVNTLATDQYQYVYPQRLTVLQVIGGTYTSGSAKLQASLLHTYVSEKVKTGLAAPSKSLLSPMISFQVSPAGPGGMMFRAFYKNIFRNPTFNDLYYGRLGSISLKPEYTSQYNAGVAYTPVLSGKLKALSLSADAYYNRVKDKIIAVPNKDIFSWTMRNLGAVDIRGLELAAKLSYKISAAYTASASANYTFQHAVDVTDPESSVYLRQIPYTPEHTADLNAGIDNGWLGVYFTHSFAAQRYYLGENLPQYRVPGFSVTDMTLSWFFRYAKIPASVTGSLNNIFNKQYAIVRSFPMPGRSVRIALKVTI